MKHLLVCFSLAALSFAQTQPAAAPSTKDEKKGIVEGQLINLLNNEPIRKGDLTLRRSRTNDPLNMGALLGNSGGSSYSNTSDQQGKFRFENVTPGAYTLSSKKNGFIDAVYGQRAPNTPGTVITVGAGGSVSDLNFKMTPQGVVSGHAFDEDGEPLNGTTVMVLRPQYYKGKRQMMPAGQSQVNDKGEYRISNLNPGKYIILAQQMRMNPTETAPAKPADGKPETGYAPTYYPGVSDTSQATKIEIGPGQELGGQDIRFQKTPVFRVKGRIVDGVTGQAMKDLVVLYMPRDQFTGMRSMSAMKGGDGAFEIAGVAPGSYVLMAASMSAAGLVTGIMYPFDVSDRDLEGLVVTAQAGQSVNGTVVLDDSSKKIDLHSTRLIMLPARGIPVGTPMASPKPDGTFTLEKVVAIQYTHFVPSTPDGTYVKSVKFADQEVLSKDIDLTGGVSGSFTITLGTNPATVTGSAKLKDQPVSGATVVLVPTDNTRRHSNTIKVGSTDQTGNVNLKDVPPGEYLAFAWDKVDWGAWEDPEFLKPFETSAEKVKVAANEKASVQLKVIPAAE